MPVFEGFILFYSILSHKYFYTHTPYWLELTMNATTMIGPVVFAEGMYLAAELS